MGKLFLLILIVITTLGIIGFTSAVPSVQLNTTTNYTTVSKYPIINIFSNVSMQNVNSSDYWDDLDTPADILTSTLNNDAFWEIVGDQTGLTGDKSGSFDFSTTGNIAINNIVYDDGLHIKDVNFRIEDTVPTIRFKETGVADKNWIMRSNGGDMAILTANDDFSSVSTKLIIDNAGDFDFQSGDLNTTGEIFTQILHAGLSNGEIRSYQSSALYISLKTDTSEGKSGIYRSNVDAFPFYYDTGNGDSVVKATFGYTSDIDLQLSHTDGSTNVNVKDRGGNIKASISDNGDLVMEGFADITGTANISSVFIDGDIINIDNGNLILDGSNMAGETDIKVGTNFGLNLYPNSSLAGHVTFLSTADSVKMYMANPSHSLDIQAENISTDILTVQEVINLDADNGKLFWGESQDASIYYDNTDLVINPKEVGSGIVHILGDLHVSGVITQGSMPESITALAGVMFNTVENLTYQDGDYVHVIEVPATPGFNILVNFTGLHTNPRELVFIGRYDGSGTHQVEVRVFNYVTSNYDDIREGIKDIQFFSGASEITREWAFPSPNSNYVDGGNVSVQIIHTSAGNSAHDLYIDKIQLLD